MDNYLENRLRAILGVKDNVEVLFRHPTKNNGFTFSISSTPKEIEEIESNIKQTYPFIVIEGKSNIDEEDPEFQCLYCEFVNPT
jgi:hypothetical protein